LGCSAATTRWRFVLVFFKGSWRFVLVFFKGSWRAVLVFFKGGWRVASDFSRAADSAVGLANGRGRRVEHWEAGQDQLSWIGAAGGQSVPVSYYWRTTVNTG
jgi:hypothetical protein